MPMVINVVDFLRKSATHLKKLEEEDYIFVANETYADRSFVITSPNNYIKLNIEAGYVERAKDIDDLVETVKQKVSEKYRNIRGKRREKEDGVTTLV